jgi:hypothetical protein
MGMSMILLMTSGLLGYGLRARFFETATVAVKRRCIRAMATRGR